MGVFSWVSVLPSAKLMMNLCSEFTSPSREPQMTPSLHQIDTFNQITVFFLTKPANLQIILDLDFFFFFLDFRFQCFLYIGTLSTSYKYPSKILISSHAFACWHPIRPSRKHYFTALPNLDNTCFSHFSLLHKVPASPGQTSNFTWWKGQNTSSKNLSTIWHPLLGKK